MVVLVKLLAAVATLGLVLWGSSSTVASDASPPLPSLSTKNITIDGNLIVTGNLYGNGFPLSPYTSSYSFYVALNGSDVTGTGSIVNPWATITHANAILVAAGLAGSGVTNVYIGPGNWYENWQSIDLIYTGTARGTAIWGTITVPTSGITTRPVLNDMVINSAQTWNATSGVAPTIRNVNFQAPLTITSVAVSASALAQGCQFQSTVTLVDVSFPTLNSYGNYFRGAFYVTQSASPAGLSISTDGTVFAGGANFTQLGSQSITILGSGHFLSAPNIFGSVTITPRYIPSVNIGSTVISTSATLPTIATAGTYTCPASVTIRADGFVTSITSGTCGTPAYHVGTYFPTITGVLPGDASRISATFTQFSSASNSGFTGLGTATLVVTNAGTYQVQISVSIIMSASGTLSNPDTLLVKLYRSTTSPTVVSNYCSVPAITSGTSSCTVSYAAQMFFAAGESMQLTIGNNGASATTQSYGVTGYFSMRFVANP